MKQKKWLMQSKDFFFSESIYSEHLATINGIKFTRREVDVISCLLSARGTSKIASLLSVALRTVVTHIRNIMLKLECNSREGIIDFIERSQKLPFLREYYIALTTEVAFEKSLKEISKLKHEGSLNSLVIYWEDENQKQILLTYLGGHLDLAGFKVEIKEYTDGNKPEPTRDSYPISLLFVKKDLSSSCSNLKSLNSLDLSEHTNYYYSVFEILKKLLPKTDINKIFSTFQDHSEGLQGSYRGKVVRERVPEKRESKETSFLDKILQIFKNKKWPLGAGIICISFLIIGCWIFRGKEGQGVTADSHQVVYLKKDDSIRSDLVIPTEAVLLNRPELITEIDNKLKNQHGIQTIALVGPGGAGKTTLARQYAHQQKASIIWEINAETQESLRSSFEDLARALAKTEESKNALGQIESLKDPEVRERKIIQFVREQLLTHPNWLLVFDNVEKFSDIQKHFPQDSATWGQGKIILTTRNHNIENNKLINSILQIGELTPDQKVKLFIKIVSHGKEALFTSLQMEELKAFLEYIPPFPLDVSVAAFYLKATQIPYAAYLENLSKCNKDFESVQKNLLKEAGDYTKTRYGIISLSLQHMINTHKDFRDLLLFISLLDSQNIPRSLLENYKSGPIIDQFMYALKSHSFIISESFLSSKDVTFSIHRSIQTASLAALTSIIDAQKTNQALKSIALTLNSYLIASMYKEDYSKMRILINHCEKLLRYEHFLTPGVKGIIESELGGIHLYEGDYKKAEYHLKNGLKNLSKQPDNYHSIARALGHLGMVFNNLENHKKAKNLFERSLTVFRKHTPEDHLAIGQALGYLGISYNNSGNYEKAKDILTQSIITYGKGFSDNHVIGKAWAFLHLGNTYRELGHYKKSQNLIRQTLLTYKKYFSENHVRIAQSLRALALTELELGNIREAKKLLEKILIIYTTYYPQRHLGLADVLKNIGIVEIRRGNYKKAKKLLEQCLVVYKKYESNEIAMLQTFEGLAKIYYLEGNFKDAEKFIEKAIAISQENNHPDVYIAFEMIAELYLQKERIETNKGNMQQREIFRKQAINYLNQALDIVKNHFPKDSPHIIRIEAKLKKLEEETL